MSVVVLLADAIIAQDQQPTDKDAAETTLSKQLQDLQNQKREMEGQYNAVHERLAAVEQQLSTPDPNRTVDERDLLQAVQSKLQVQEKQLSARLEGITRSIADVQKIQAPADADKPPFTASLLLVKADWSKSPKAKEIETELREALKGLNVPQEQLDKLPASATEILFPPRVQETYSTQHWQEFLNWLRKNELIVEKIPFDIVPPKQSGARVSLGYQELRRPYDFLDLPPLSIENSQPFIRWDLAFDWKMQLSGEDRGGDESMATIINAFSIFETARGEPTKRVKADLAYRRITIRNLSNQEVAVMSGFADPELLAGARRRGFAALVVVQPGEFSAANEMAHLVLPDRVEDLLVGDQREFPFEMGGTLIVEQGGGGFRGRGYTWKNEPKPASKTPGQHPPAEQSPAAQMISVFHLKHIPASSAERILKQIFARARVTIAAEEGTNRIVVSAAKKDMDQITELLNSLDQEHVAVEADKAAAAASVTPPRNMPAAELAKAYAAKEEQAAHLAGEIRKAAGENANQPALESRKSELRRTVSEAFALRQQLHRAELAELAQRMQHIEQNLQAKSRISDAIITRRVEDLLNPDLRWDEPLPHARFAQTSSEGPQSDGTVPAFQLTPLPIGARISGSVDALIANVLGVKVEEVTPESPQTAGYSHGLLVTEVRPQLHPSQVRPGDVIVGLHNWQTGTKFAVAWALLQPIAKKLMVLSPGERAEPEKAAIHVWRDGKPISFELDLPPYTPNSNQPARPAMPVAAAPAIGAGGASATVNLPTPQEFRRQLSDVVASVKRFEQQSSSGFAGRTPEESDQEPDAALQSARKRLEFVRAEYAAQIRLLELEVNAAKAELKNAEEGAQIAEAGFRAAKKPRSAVIEARQPIVAARLRLERATTLLDLYRKADPQASAAGAPSSTAPAAPPGDASAAPPPAGATTNASNVP
jgi:hypothetical protein